MFDEIMERYVDDMEQIVTAVATDPLAMFFPIPPEKIQEIALKAIG